MTLQGPGDDLSQPGEEGRVNCVRCGLARVGIPADGQTDEVKAGVFDQFEIFFFNSKSPIAFMRRFEHVAQIHAMFQRDVGWNRGRPDKQEDAGGQQDAFHVGLNDKALAAVRLRSA